MLQLFVLSVSLSVMSSDARIVKYCSLSLLISANRKHYYNVVERFSQCYEHILNTLQWVSSVQNARFVESMQSSTQVYVHKNDKVSHFNIEWLYICTVKTLCSAFFFFLHLIEFLYINTVELHRKPFYFCLIKWILFNSFYLCFWFVIKPSAL